MPPTNPGLMPPLALDENIRLAMEQIRALSESDIPRIPEAVFCDRILPLMVERGQTSQDLAPWMELASNPQMPMDVVDENDQVLFRVPPLIRSIPTRMPRNSGESIDQLMGIAELKTNQHPIAGQVFLRQNLSRRVPQLGNDHASIAQWDAILTRYGHTPLRHPPATAVENAPTPSIFTGEDDEL